MSQALAPRLPRGISWFRSAIAVIVLSAAAVPAAAQPPAEPKGKASKPADVAPAPVAEVALNEVFLDPNAKAALAIIQPLNFVGQAIRVGPGQPDATTIQNMAVEAMAVDTAFLKRYVEFFAVELSRRDNINAMINPPPGLQPNAARGLERAVDALTDPILRARANDKPGFLNAYNKVLFESSLVKLLDNNLFSRIDAMIVLGMSGSNSPAALDLFTAQIKKPEQVVWVKMWAARGLTNATREGRDNLDANKTILASEALVGFLNGDPKLPWPVQMRAMEALGSLRLSFSQVRGKVDAASVAMRFLADPDARLEVRAYAAWALGMMKAPGQVRPYNFPLLGHEIGEVAADLGRKIIEEYDKNAANFDREKDRATTLTSLLIFQVYPALTGLEGVTESGLNRSTHPDLAAARSFLKDLDARVKDVTRESYELLRAGGIAQKSRRDDLDAKVAALKGFLSKSMPKDRHVLPGGPEIAPNAAQVAGAPGR